MSIFDFIVLILFIVDCHSQFFSFFFMIDPPHPQQYFHIAFHDDVALVLFV